MADPYDDARRAPGWKRDPWQRFAGRYWDGEQWTEHVVTAEKVRSVDPVPATPPVTERAPAAAPEPALAPTVAMETAHPAVSKSATPRPWSTTWSSIKGWPRWAHWMGGIFLLLLLIGAATGGPDEVNDNDAPRPVVGDSATTLTLPLATTTEMPTTTVAATTVPSTTLPPATATTGAPVTTRTTVATTVATTAAPTTASVFYANCDAVRAAGKAPLYRGQPGYRSALDRDNDGIACDVTGG